MTGDLGKRTVSGVRWMVLNAVGEKALSFGTTMVLARMLDPEHFGLYALAFVVIDAFQIFKNLGLDAALIQRRDRVEEAADTAMLILPVVGIAFFALLYAVAPACAMLLRQPDLTRPLQALGGVLILMGVGNVPMALVQRSMRFDLRTIANLTAMTVYATLAITLARAGWGVWSLVIAYLTRCAVAIPILWVLSGWRPQWRFDRQLLMEMLHYSKFVVGAWVVGLLAMNIDKVAIGRWLGTTVLGHYTLCLGLANIVVSQLTAQIYQVAFPAFSRAQGDVQLLRRGVIKLLKLLLMASAPVGVWLITAAPEFLETAYGAKWVEAAPVLQVLALAGVLQTLRAGLEPVLMGLGKSRIVFMLNLLQLVLLAAGTVLTARAGSLMGVAWSVVAAAAVPGIISCAAVNKRTGLTIGQLWQALWPLAGAAATMAAVILTATVLRPSLGGASLPVFAWTGIIGVLGGATYLTALHLMDPALNKEVLGVLRRQAAAGST